MFSNQYMGTRLASRSLPRSSNQSTLFSPRTQSGAFSVASQPKPVNAREFDEADEEVDYSFMNLPVRERRKMFLRSNDHGSGAFQATNFPSMTVPRRKAATLQHSTRLETQSELAANDYSFDWEPSPVRQWATNVRAEPSAQLSRSSTSRTIILNNPRLSQSAYWQPTENQMGRRTRYSAFQTSPTIADRQMGKQYFSEIHTHPNSNHDQQLTAVRVNESFTPAPLSRVVRTATTKIYPSRYYDQNAHGLNISYGQPNFGHEWEKPTMVQPLRVSIQNSDPLFRQRLLQPERVRNSASISPIYPAYPAHLERIPANHNQPHEERTRRGFSVQPRNPSPNYRIVDQSNTTRLVNPTDWTETVRTSRGQFTAKSLTHRLQKHDLPENVGISDF